MFFILNFWIECLLPFNTKFPFLALFNCSNRKTFWSVSQSVQVIYAYKVGVIKYLVVEGGGLQQFLDMERNKILIKL